MRKSLLAAAVISVLAIAPAMAQESLVPTEEPAAEAAAVEATPAVEATGAIEATPAVEARRGQVVVASSGARLGRVVYVTDSGAPQIIFEGKTVTLPLDTLSEAGSRLATSLTPAEVASLN